MTLGFPQLPGVLGWLQDFLIGHWPEGDEDAMRRVAQHWSDAADALEKLQQPADLTMNAALAAIDGKIGDAMSSYWQQLVGGDGSDLKKIIGNCESYAKQLEQGATDIEYTKLTIYVSVGTIVAMAFIPGVGWAVDAVAANAVRLAVRMAVQQLIARLGVRGAAYAAERAAVAAIAKASGTVVRQTLPELIAKQALIGAALGGGTDAAVQGIQFGMGTRDDFNFQSLFLSTGAGAVAGSIAGTLGERAAISLTPRLAETNAAASVIAMGAAQVPGNVLGNAAAATTMAAATGNPIDMHAVAHGAGGGLISKPAGPHGGSTVEAGGQGGTSAGNGIPAVKDTTVHAVDQPVVTVSAAATTAPVVDSAPHSTLPAGHGNPVVAHPDSPSSGQPVAAASNPAHQGGAGQPVVGDRGVTGAGAPTTTAPDRAPGAATTTHGGGTPAPDRNLPAGATRMPADNVGRPEITSRPETSARPETQSPATRAETPARSGEKSFGTGEQPGRSPESPATGKPGEPTHGVNPEHVRTPAEEGGPAGDRDTGDGESPASHSRNADEGGEPPASNDHTGHPVDSRPEPGAPDDTTGHEAPGLPEHPHEPLELTDHDRKLIDKFADKHGLSAEEVVRGIETGKLELGSYAIWPKPPDAVPTPDKLTAEYLNQVIDQLRENPLERQRYTSAEPESFRAGCPDTELPGSLTRSMPEHALDNSVSPIDSDRIEVNHESDGLSPMWRDQSAGDAYLDPKNALFRMDSRGTEIFEHGFAPRDPANLNISAHVGDAGSGRPDGFVSLSRSAEHTVLRDQFQLSGNDLARLAAEGKVERLPDGTYRQMRYMHELYTPHGIDVDATYHDATAHSRYNTGGHQEAEILAPGGISGDSVYRTWPRETIYDPNGNILSSRVGEPIHNPDFAHLNNSRFAESHERGGVADESHSQAPRDRAVPEELATPERLVTDRDGSGSLPEHGTAPKDDGHPDSPVPAPDTAHRVRQDAQPENDGTAPVSSAPRSENPPVQTVPDYSAPLSPHTNLPPTQHAPHAPDVAPVAQSPVHTAHEQSPQPAPRTNPVEHAPHQPDSRAPEQRAPRPDQQSAQQSPHAQQQAPHERGPVEAVPARTTAHPDGLGTHPNSPQPRTVSPHEVRQANQIRQVREWYRTQPPEGGRVTPVPIDHSPNGKPAYDFHRHPDAHGGPIAVTSIKVHVTFDGTVTPEHVARVWEHAQLATDLAFNHGQRLLSGDRVMVDLVHTSDPSTAHLNIHVTDAPGPWHPNSHPDAMAQQLREHLGLFAEPDRSGFGPEEIRQLSNDIAKANTPAALDGLRDTRSFGREQLQQVEKPEYQHAVEDALRDGNRFLVGADPRDNPYGRLINDGGPEQPGRSNDCLDNSLAALSSFNGRPEVAAPRWPDRLPDGSIDNRSGERGGLQRAAEWIGGEVQSYNDGRPVKDQFQALHNWIEQLGPGSSALVYNQWHAVDSAVQPLFHENGTPKIDGAHATVVVYPRDASGPVWWDPQLSRFSDTPPSYLADRSAHMEFMTVDPQGGPHGAGTAPHHEPAGAVPGRDLPGPGVRDDLDRARLGVPPETHPRADRPEPGSGPGELRGEQEHGGGDRAPEPAPTHDRGDVRRGDPGGPTDRQTDLPTPAEREHPTTPGRFDHDPVPGANRIDSTTGPDHGIPADHRQEHPRVPADSTHGSERGVVDGLAPESGRPLAEPGDVPGVGPDRTADADRDLDSDGSEFGAEVDTSTPEYQRTREADFDHLVDRNQDLRQSGLEAVRELNNGSDPAADGVRRPDGRTITTLLYRMDSGSAGEEFGYSGDGHDWPPANETHALPKEEYRLFESKEVALYNPRDEGNGPSIKPRLHDSEVKLLEELSRRHLEELSGLDREAVDDAIRKSVRKIAGWDRRGFPEIPDGPEGDTLRQRQRIADEIYEDMREYPRYPQGLEGEAMRARHRIVEAVRLLNEAAASAASNAGRQHVPFTVHDISGDVRMVVDLPAGRDYPPAEQICGSCQDVIVAYQEAFPGIRIEVRNLKHEELWNE
ncbi:hypothetical protein H0264_37675 [Nocardia huaxiensis]|uniref:Uncharacterized protein n=1 Tax=Nocardia huaxiensis TaxID=2755382 RepID=A0A7D6ZIX7_9NOCA|nr:toxin glutamine deamidase domain-containing protein [Nocardia huaxiensis]QLY30760.1 hypothetical protein H0264_37675 [Nocardia huaxiensis]